MFNGKREVSPLRKRCRILSVNSNDLHLTSVSKTHCQFLVYWHAFGGCALASEHLMTLESVMQLAKSTVKSRGY